MIPRVFCSTCREQWGCRVDAVTKRVRAPEKEEFRNISVVAAAAALTGFVSHYYIVRRKLLRRQI